MKHWFKQIINYLKPFKNDGTVGMYQRIFVYAIWIIVICVAISIVGCILIQSNNKWLGLVNNYAIGIACSAFLVAVTALMQFINNRNALLSSYSKTMVGLLTALIDAASLKESLSEQECDIKWSIISKCFDEYNDVNIASLYWFNIDKNDSYLKNCSRLLQIQMPFIKYENHVTTIKKLDRELIIECISEMEKITKDYYTAKFNIFGKLRYIAETYEEEKN